MRHAPIVQEERRVSCGLRTSGVQSELDSRKFAYPVLLLHPYALSEHLGQRAVRSLSSTVGFRVVSARNLELDADEFMQALPEYTGKE